MRALGDFGITDTDTSELGTVQYPAPSPYDHIPLPHKPILGSSFDVATFHPSWTVPGLHYTGLGCIFTLSA